MPELSGPIVLDEVVPALAPWTAVVKKGQTLRIVDLEGNQAVDFLMYALEDDAEVMSNTQLAEQITGQPPEVEAAVLAINAEARSRSLQFALLVPLLAGVLGFANSFRMMRLPDLKPPASAEQAGLG